MNVLLGYLIIGAMWCAYAVWLQLREGMMEKWSRDLLRVGTFNLLLWPVGLIVYWSVDKNDP